MGRINVEQTELDGVLVITPQVHGDNRGFFQESYNKKDFLEKEIAYRFVQDNHSFSKTRGTIRGFHFQTPPMAQTKLVRVVKGEVYDVAVDIRVGSHTFGQYVGQILSDMNNIAMYIPEGFAHGFLSLSRNVIFQYKCTEFYYPEDE